MQQKGIIYIPVLLLLISVVTAGTVLINSQYLSDVKGVLIAKDGGGDSGGSSGSSGGSSGSSDSGSHDSGSSGSSSNSSNSGSSNSGQGSTNTSSTSSSGSTSSNSGSGSSGSQTESKSNQAAKAEKGRTEIKKEKKEIEKREVENETENGLEDELEKAEVKEVEFKINDAEIEGEIKEDTGSTTKGTAKKLTVNLTKVKGEKEIELAAEEENFKIKSKGVEVETNFPLSFNKQTGQLFVKTKRGLREIRILPDQVATIAKSKGIQNQIDKIELVEQESNDEVIARVQGIKSGKLFGLIPLSAKVETEIGTQTANIISNNQPFWLTILSRFII